MKRGLLVLSSLLIVGLAGHLYFDNLPTDQGKPQDAHSDVTSKNQQKIAAGPDAFKPEVTTIQSQSTAPTEVLEDDFRRLHAKNVVAQLENDLNSLMAPSGFTQAEIDVAAKLVGSAFLNPVDGAVELSLAIDSVADTLRLDKDRAKNMENAVFKAIRNNTGRYSFSEYLACVQLRTASASPCIKEIADELTQKVSARAEGDVVDAKAISALEPEAALSIKRAIEECGEKADTAESYLKVNLGGCL